MAGSPHCVDQTLTDAPWEDVSQGFVKPLARNRSLEQVKKKSGFQITRVVDRGHAGTDDGDVSVDDLDDTCETRTEDVSSDILDLSKNTDIEAEPSSSEETTPSYMTEEVCRDGVKSSLSRPEVGKLNTGPAADMQSRFKVVKIESKEPFRRGRWTCLDYLDHLNVEKVTEDDSSANSSASSSLQLVEQDLDTTAMPADTMMVIDPSLYPTNSSQLPNGVEYSVQFMPVPHSTTLLPQEPSTQSFDIGASIPPQVMGSQSASVTIPQSTLPATGPVLAAVPNQAPVPEPEPGTSVVLDYGDQPTEATHDTDERPAEVQDPPDPPAEDSTVVAELNPAATLTNQSFLSPPLLEMVSATAQPVNPSKEEREGERSLLHVFSGASTVAIDNKIEQAMDLVKSHLMFAVREEVEVLKEQIKELLEKNSQLEYEINILKANASPETLQKLAQVSQTTQHPPSSST